MHTFLQSSIRTSPFLMHKHTEGLILIPSSRESWRQCVLRWGFAIISPWDLQSCAQIRTVTRRVPSSFVCVIVKMGVAYTTTIRHRISWALLSSRSMSRSHMILHDVSQVSRLLCQHQLWVKTFWFPTIYNDFAVCWVCIMFLWLICLRQIYCSDCKNKAVMAAGVECTENVIWWIQLLWRWMTQGYPDISPAGRPSVSTCALRPAI